MSWIADVVDAVKGWFYRMFTREELKKAIGYDIAPTEEQQKTISLWASMYRNQAPWMDNDSIFSLNLPVTIASELARAATSEMTLTLSGSARATWLQTQIQPIVDDIRTDLEVGLALGGMVWKPVPDGKNINVSVIPADAFYPVRFDSAGEVVSAVFVEQRQVGKKYYTKLEAHDIDKQGVYTVTNKAFESDSPHQLGREAQLSVIDDWATLEPIATIIGADKLLFAYFKAPGGDVKDTGSPLGVSCYSRAVDLIEQADRLHSGFLWEFESGKRALYADVVAFQRKDDGTLILPDKRLYRALNSTSNVGEGDLFKEWTPSLREQNYLNGLSALYRRIELATGLAYGTLSDPELVARTATEVASTKQRTYSTIRDIQRSLRTALERLVFVMDFYSTAYALAPKGAYNLEFEFDDSILVDKDAQMQVDRQAVSMGLMPKAIFLMRNYGLDEKTANLWLQQQRAESPTDVFGA